MTRASASFSNTTNDSANTSGQGDELSLLPHNMEAEQALLGVLLHHNESLEKVVAFLKAEHFYDPVHQRLYQGILHFVNRGQLASPITLSHYFKKDEALADVGGSAYLANLAGLVVSFANTLDYGRQIYDLFLRRQLIHLGEDLVQQAKAYVFDVTPLNTIEQTEKRLFDLATLGEKERGFQAFSNALAEAVQTAQTAFKRDSHVVGVTTGFEDLDKQLGGFHPSDLVILAGRPSMGKTALATNIAFNAALASLRGKEGEGARVAFFSLEMSSEQLAMRLLGQETGIPSDRIRRGAISQEDFPKFVDVSRQLGHLPLYIDDTPALTIAGLRTRARRLQRQQGLGLIVIDYLQLLSSTRTSSENRVQELSEITRGLKTLAKELEVPVLALSQLSRAVEQREDKRPQLSDLRESGSIEQDADVVLFVYREEYYESRKKPQEGTEKMEAWQQQMAGLHNRAEVVIAKQRHGPIGSIYLHFEGKLTKFSNLISNDRVPHAPR
ncbi:MAG: replicative DNA helicase [Alphaproteobacteria bacterium]